MSKIAIKGADTGTGVFTLESPATNTDRTLTLPDEAGTVLTDRVIAVDASAPDDSVVVNSSGNVGIGTSSPSALYKLTVSDSVYISSNADVTPDAGWSGQLTINGDGYSGGLALDSSGIWLGNNSASRAVIFATNETERARITSDGDLLVGKQGSSLNNTGLQLTQAGTLSLTRSGSQCLVLNRQNTNGAIIHFYRGVDASLGSTVGSVSVTTTSTAYNTSSDYRLKEDWVAVADASTRVNALKPVNFAWKIDGKRVDGFLAHEVAEVVPEAVTGEKDAVELVDIKDEDGNVTGQEERPVYQGIDQSKLVPLLTAALQEALARIETLEADVATLKGNV